MAESHRIVSRQVARRVLWVGAGMLIALGLMVAARVTPRAAADPTADRPAATPGAADDSGVGAVIGHNPHNHAPGASLSTKDLSLEQAHAVIAAAVVKAREINTKMDIAVVDAGGNLKGFARMDGAWLGSIDISIKKARTARSFDMPTGELGKLSQPGGPLWQIEVSNGGLITFPGGVPIKAADGTILGAIGVSGSTVENDHAVAAAGAAAVK